MYCGICCSPHLTGKCGTRPFLGGSGRRARARMCLAFPKMPTAQSAFPLLGVMNPPQGVKAWGKGPLRPKEISRYRDTLGQICAADNTAGRSATRHLERYRPMVICLLVFYCCSSLKLPTAAFSSFEASLPFSLWELFARSYNSQSGILGVHSQLISKFVLWWCIFGQ